MSSAETKKDEEKTPETQQSMAKYCQSLETWLNQVYWHNQVAYSAYMTAISILYSNTNNNFVNNGTEPNGSANGNTPGGRLPNNLNNNNNNNVNRDFRAAIVQQQ